MFGPALPIHVRARIYRRRLSAAMLIAALILSATLLYVDYEPARFRPPRAGYLGPPLLVENLDEIRDEVADRDLLAGGHPMPEAMEAIELELELTHRAPDFTVEEREGKKDREVPDPSDPKPGHADGERQDDRNATPLSLRSREVVVLKFVKPPYPGDARLLGVEGMVLVNVLVGEDGSVLEALTQARGSLLPSCINAARRAALQWRFAPLVDGGVPRQFWVEIPFNFTLRGVTAGT